MIPKTKFKNKVLNLNHPHPQHSQHTIQMFNVKMELRYYLISDEFKKSNQFTEKKIFT